MNVPPSMNMEKTYIGVGKREIIITVFFALAGALAGFLLPVPFELVYVRVGLAVFIGLIGLGIAATRIPGSRMTLEQFLFSFLAYRSRARHRQMNYDPQSRQSGSGRQAISNYFTGHEGVSTPEAVGEGKLVVRALDFGYQMFFSILSFTGLAMFITWLIAGGGAELKTLIDQISPFPRSWMDLLKIYQ